MNINNVNLTQHSPQQVCSVDVQLPKPRHSNDVPPTSWCQTVQPRQAGAANNAGQDQDLARSECLQGDDDDGNVSLKFTERNCPKVSFSTIMDENSANFLSGWGNIFSFIRFQYSSKEVCFWSNIRILLFNRSLSLGILSHSDTLTVSYSRSLWVESSRRITLHAFAARLQLLTEAIHGTNPQTLGSYESCKCQNRSGPGWICWRAPAGGGAAGLQLSKHNTVMRLWLDLTLVFIPTGVFLVKLHTQSMGEQTSRFIKGTVFLLFLGVATGVNQASLVLFLTGWRTSFASQIEPSFCKDTAWWQQKEQSESEV